MDSIFQFRGSPQEQRMYLQAQAHSLGDFPVSDDAVKSHPWYGRLLLALADCLIDAGHHLRCLAQKAQPLSQSHV